ncbi:helix-loop-helix DNA-binding domain-containing protein [Diaporthe sp. PMI_573]|nr:helix-loop-helix DNA-binding domain-containing protein [Diaporthaceae sp. PMI_573]
MCPACLDRLFQFLIGWLLCLPILRSFQSSHEFSALIFSDTQGNCDAESVSPLLPSLSVLYPFDCDLPSLFEMSNPSPELYPFLGGPFGNPLSSCAQNPELSPTTSSAGLEVDTVIFGREGDNVNQPLFHTHDAITRSQFQLQKQQSNEFLCLDRNSVTSTGSHQEREEQKEQQQQPTQSQTKKQKANSRSNRKTKSVPPAPFAKKSVQSKNTHNMAEKRYRVKINHKMTALRDAVPSMRRIVKKKDNLQAATVDHEKALDIIGEENGPKQACEIGQPKTLTRLTVLSKATILIMATEYVAQLEMKNAELLEDNAQLEERFRKIDVASMV